jgi:hypothetical protein
VATTAGLPDGEVMLVMVGFANAVLPPWLVTGR